MEEILSAVPTWPFIRLRDERLKAEGGAYPLFLFYFITWGCHVYLLRCFNGGLLYDLLFPALHHAKGVNLRAQAHRLILNHQRIYKIIIIIKKNSNILILASFQSSNQPH